VQPERREDEPTDVDSFNQEVGSNVHAAMVKRGVKGIEIAKLLELEPQSLSARLHGRTPFKAHELRVIAERLGVHPGEFFGGVTEGAYNPRCVDLSVVPQVGQMSLPLGSFAPSLELVNS
jgi:transcriptional regulator with XRE-family HTH domain